MFFSNKIYGLFPSRLQDWVQYKKLWTRFKNKFYFINQNYYEI